MYSLWLKLSSFYIGEKDIKAFSYPIEEFGLGKVTKTPQKWVWFIVHPSMTSEKWYGSDFFIFPWKIYLKNFHKSLFVKKKGPDDDQNQEKITDSEKSIQDTVW